MHAWPRFFVLIAALPLVALIGCTSAAETTAASPSDAGTVPPDDAGPDADSGDADLPDPEVGTVIVGVTSDLRAGIDVKSLHVVMSVDGDVVKDEVLALGDGELDFPIELDFADRPDGALVDAEIEAFGDAPDAPIVTRSASTRVVGGKKLLIRAAIEAACVPHPGDVPCEDGFTCESGVCRDPFKSPDVLETYTDQWSELVPDVCKPIGAGDPIVIIGEGQAGYVPLADYGVSQVEEGIQGGFHIWLALRLQNLRHAGSITELTGSVPELGAELPPSSFIFSFEPGADSYCTLPGLRFRLDQPLDVHDLLGKVIKVNVKITDSDHAVGKAEKFITLSSEYTPIAP